MKQIFRTSILKRPFILLLTQFCSYHWNAPSADVSNLWAHGWGSPVGAAGGGFLLSECGWYPGAHRLSCGVKAKKSTKKLWCNARLRTLRYKWMPRLVKFAAGQSPVILVQLQKVWSSGRSGKWFKSWSKWIYIWVPKCSWPSHHSKKKINCVLDPTTIALKICGCGCATFIHQWKNPTLVNCCPSNTDGLF